MLSLSFTRRFVLIPLFLSCYIQAGLARHAPEKPESSQRSFNHLLDAGRGTHMAGISDLKRYFTRFGYLPESETRNLTDSFDTQFELTVMVYQTRHGLPVTGKLDSATLEEIMSPRCGVSDTVSTSRAHSVQRFAFFPGEPRWDRPGPLLLTYAISPTATVYYLSRADVEAVFRSAFARWAQVIPVRFLEADDYESADVKIGFYEGDHGDGEPFDGVLGILAHAFSPESGWLHLDGAERWSVDFSKEKSSIAIDLESVATHEIGHVLGLAHSPVREAIMYPSLSPRTKKTELRVDDVEGVQELYGSNPGFRLSSLMESDTSAASGGLVFGGSGWWGLGRGELGFGLVAVVATICVFVI